MNSMSLRDARPQGERDAVTGGALRVGGRGVQMARAAVARITDGAAPCRARRRWHEYTGHRTVRLKQLSAT